MVTKGELTNGLRVPLDWELYTTHGTVECKTGDIILWNKYWTCSVPDEEWEVGEYTAPGK